MLKSDKNGNPNSQWIHKNRNKILELFESDGIRNLDTSHNNNNNRFNRDKMLQDRKTIKIILGTRERLFRVIYANYCFISLFKYVCLTFYNKYIYILSFSN